VPDSSPPVRPVPGLRRLTADELAAEVRGVRSGRARGLPTRLSMPAVLTLAHLWGVPGAEPGEGGGGVLAELAKGQPVGRDALLTDVQTVIAHCERTRPDGVPAEDDVDVQQLTLLREWVESQP
jgi:hypothetical protein